jgi:hypothetical protein
LRAPSAPYAEQSRWEIKAWLDQLADEPVSVGNPTLRAVKEKG